MMKKVHEAGVLIPQGLTIASRSKVPDSRREKLDKSTVKAPIDANPWDTIIMYVITEGAAIAVTLDYQAFIPYLVTQAFRHSHPPRPRSNLCGRRTIGHRLATELVLGRELVIMIIKK